MKLNDKVQHVYLVGAKSLGAYGGYETFVYKLTEYHQNKENIKYHVACKANGDGCMDESKFDGVTKINDHEFELHNTVYTYCLVVSPNREMKIKLKEFDEHSKRDYRPRNQFIRPIINTNDKYGRRSKSISV